MKNIAIRNKENRIKKMNLMEVIIPDYKKAYPSHWRTSGTYSFPHYVNKGSKEKLIEEGFKKELIDNYYSFVEERKNSVYAYPYTPSYLEKIGVHRNREPLWVNVPKSAKVYISCVNWAEAFGNVSYKKKYKTLYKKNLLFNLEDVKDVCRKFGSPTREENLCF